MNELTDQDLEMIQWRATRGCHFEDAFLVNSLYAKECLEEDVPRLIAEIRRLRANQAIQPTADAVGIGTKNHKRGG